MGTEVTNRCYVTICFFVFILYLTISLTGKVLPIVHYYYYYCDKCIDINYLETECRLFPPVTKFLDLFLCAGYFFNALY